MSKRCLIRGGNWNNGENNGVFNSNLNNPRSNSNGNIGGRSALPSGGHVCTYPRTRAVTGSQRDTLTFPCIRIPQVIHGMEEMTAFCGDGNATHRQPGEVKTINDVFTSMTGFEKINDAYNHATAQKRYRDEVLEFSNDRDSNLLKIQGMVRDGTFRFGPYRKHWVYVPKKRLVMALPIESRTVQWMVYQELSPFYDRLMIEDSYACRENKGSLRAARRLQYWMRNVECKKGEWYCVKIDISKYFYRVDHGKLIGILGRRIKDERLMDLIRKIIDSDGERFGLPRFMSAEDVSEDEWLGDVGMPIGNLTSQLFANIYLNELDQYCKHTLGIRMYIRYMDDIIIITDGRREAFRNLDLIRAFAMEKLSLDLNSKTAVRPLGTVEFVGFIVSPGKLKLRKQTVRRIKSSFHGICSSYFDGRLTHTEFERRVASYNGMAKHVDNRKLKARLNGIYLFERAKAGTINDKGESENG